MTTWEKQRALDAIGAEISRCEICKTGKSGKAVPGEGNPDANIVFVGEAPGKQEAKTGEPFIGRSGKLLRGIIQSVGIKEEDMFIFSPVKYLPDRGTPTKADIMHGMIHTRKQLDVIDPKVIVLLGSSAALGLLGEKILVTKRHGEMLERNKKTYLITFHPSAALRFPNMRKLLEEDFQFLTH